MPSSQLQTSVIPRLNTCVRTAVCVCVRVRARLCLCCEQEMCYNELERAGLFLKGCQLVKRHGVSVKLELGEVVLAVIMRRRRCHFLSICFFLFF